MLLVSSPSSSGEFSECILPFPFSHKKNSAPFPPPIALFFPFPFTHFFDDCAGFFFFFFGVFFGGGGVFGGMFLSPRSGFFYFPFCKMFKNFFLLPMCKSLF